MVDRENSWKDINRALISTPCTVCVYVYAVSGFSVRLQE